MGSSAKSSSGKSSSVNEHGRIYYTFGRGPLDWLTALIHNGNYLFGSADVESSLMITSDVTDLTGALADPTYIAPGGSLKIFRGTWTQPADMRGHYDKGAIKLEGYRLFFGQDTGAAPTVQMIGGHRPRVDTSIVAAEHNVVDDWQINPIAWLAEFLLDDAGAGWPIERLDAPSWRAAAAWCYEHRDITFCSPLITEQMPLRELVKQLLEPFNGFLRRTSSGTVQCKIYEWGVDPGDVPVLDANAWTERPEFNRGDWRNVPTELLFNFTNRAFEYQRDSHKVPYDRARRVRQLDDQKTMARPHVTRIEQIHKQGIEWFRRMGTAPSPCVFKVRAPVIDALDLQVGDKVKVDTNPEPGGPIRAQLCRIDKIEEDGSDVATLSVTTDNLVPATAYTPTWNPPEVSNEPSPPLEHFLGVALPPDSFHWPPAVGILATRPSAAVHGFRVYFGTTAAGEFAVLGEQFRFAVRAQLAAGISAGATSANFTELDGLDAPDASIAADTAGGNATKASDDYLVALIAQLDGNGRIAIGGDGNPVMEFVSIVDRAQVAGATFSYDILRGRKSTSARAWTAGAAVWIVRAADIAEWRHELLSANLGNLVYFRMVSFTRVDDETTPVPQLAVQMPAATAPIYDNANVYGKTVEARIREVKAKTLAIKAEADELGSNLLAEIAAREAAIISEAGTRSTADSNLVTMINAVQSHLDSNVAIIGSQISALSTVNSAQATDITALYATTGTHTSQISSVSVAIADEASARASAVSSLSAAIGDVSASVATIEAAYITPDGEPVATWALMLNGGGHVTGIQAIAAGGDGSRPDYGVMIFEGCDLKSSNYVPGSSGWKIGGYGDVEFASGVFRGGLLIDSTSWTPGYAGNTATGFAVETGSNALFISRSDVFSASFNRNGPDGALVIFHKNASQVGAVQVTGTSTSYLTFSDQRFKTDLGAFELSDVAAPLWTLPLRKYRWHEWEQSDDSATQERFAYGVFAQEVAEVCPWMAHYTAETDRWGVSWDALMPNVVAALQLLNSRVAALETA